MRACAWVALSVAYSSMISPSLVLSTHFPSPRGALQPPFNDERARACIPLTATIPGSTLNRPVSFPRRRTTSSLSPGWQSHRIANKRRASARHSSLALDATASDVPQHPLPHPCRAHGSGYPRTLAARLVCFSLSLSLFRVSTYSPRCSNSHPSTRPDSDTVR